VVPFVSLSMMELVALYAALWTFFHFGSGYLSHRLPARLFVDLPFVSRTYDWERTGRIYRWLRIGAWKDRLPEAGAVLPGGFSKRRLQGRDAQYLGRFVVETSRAEFSHWLPWGMSLTFFAWNPWQIGVLMVIYGAATNAPCILVQRYNRARLRCAMATLARRAHRDRAALPANAIAHQHEIQGSN
jgi:glycosyl-4,4'-diaponeurosporenoate acyltransferase